VESRARLWWPAAIFMGLAVMMTGCSQERIVDVRPDEADAVGQTPDGTCDAPLPIQPTGWSCVKQCGGSPDFGACVARCSKREG